MNEVLAEGFMIKKMTGVCVQTVLLSLYEDDKYSFKALQHK